MSLFDDLDRHSDKKNKDNIVRAPFGYPGGKSRSVEKILEHLPYMDTYVEPFGGSAAVLLARHPSKLEVFNDRYGGVVAFYRCVRDPNKYQKMCEWLNNTVHAREDFVWCKETWKNCHDDVERAARWYYMMQYSFGGLGRNWGRSTGAKSNLAGKVRAKLPLFQKVHERFRRVQVENQDWSDALRDYDSPKTVFYLDPPYVDAYRGTYKHEMSLDDHRRLLSNIFDLKGFVALSGYSNPLYDSGDWDDKHEWDAFVSIKSIAYAGNSSKAHLKGLEKREHSKEVLWIKEAQ